MYSLRKINIIILCILLVMVTVILQACSGDQERITPVGSTIEFNPGSHSQTGIAADTCVNFTISVLYDDGLPMPEANVTIYGAFAEPRNLPNESARYQFYTLPNCDLTDPASLAVDSGFQVTTNDLGIYSYSVKIYAMVDGVENTFSDTMEAHSSSIFASAVIEVQ